MTNRELFILVVRCIGLWSIIQAVSGICMVIASFAAMWDAFRFSEGSSGDVSILLFLLNGLQPLVVLLASAYLLFRAERIAKFFYGETVADEQPRVLALTSEDLYRTFTRVLGLYAILSSVGPLSRVIAMVVRWEESARQPIIDLVPIVQAVLYLGCAFGMILGAKRIARWLSKLRYNPEDAESSGTQCEADNETKLP